MNCCCSNPDCHMNGCQIMRDKLTTTLHQGAAYGCICPPTSEQTCQSSTCPRRPWSYVTTTQQREG